MNYCIANVENFEKYGKQNVIKIYMLFPIQRQNYFYLVHFFQCFLDALTMNVKKADVQAHKHKHRYITCTPICLKIEITLNIKLKIFLSLLNLTLICTHVPLAIGIH